MICATHVEASETRDFRYLVYFRHLRDLTRFTEIMFFRRFTRFARFQRFTIFARFARFARFALYDIYSLSDMTIFTSFMFFPTPFLMWASFSPIPDILGRCVPKIIDGPRTPETNDCETQCAKRALSVGAPRPRRVGMPANPTSVSVRRSRL